MEISQLQNALLASGDWLTNQLILFENLFKPRQLLLAVYVLLTSSVLSTTSKRCFEQPAASFLVCSLIFIEYKVDFTSLANLKTLSLLSILWERVQMKRHL